MGYTNQELIGHIIPENCLFELFCTMKVMIYEEIYRAWICGQFISEYVVYLMKICLMLQLFRNPPVELDG